MRDEVLSAPSLRGVQVLHFACRPVAVEGVEVLAFELMTSQRGFELYAALRNMNSPSGGTRHHVEVLLTPSMTAIVQ
jgi:hypothetical protein